MKGSPRGLNGYAATSTLVLGAQVSLGFAVAPCMFRSFGLQRHLRGPKVVVALVKVKASGTSETAS